MPKNPFTARIALLLALFAALLLAVGADVGVAAASAKTHSATTRSNKHHVTKAHRKHRITKDRKRHKQAKARRKHAVKKVASKKVGPIATAAQATSLQPAGIPGNWSLTLDSEFTGSSLNTSIWRTGWFGSGVTSPVNDREQDCYSPSNVTFPGDGTMHLNVTTTQSTCDGVTKPYTGALLSTNPNDGRTSGGYQYTYGVVQARVYIPADGTQIADWPAVWTDGQSWPADGEDDLMEGLSGTACFHFHDPLGGPGGCVKTISPGWHTFASDWQPGSVTYYYDGKKVGSIATGVTNAPMYIILDNTVGSDDANTSEADSMQVAYVRVWQN
jgi:beta-glucanase (GH16 family)